MWKKATGDRNCSAWAASSSAVQAANALCRNASTSEAIRPSTVSSSCPSSAGSVIGTSSTAWLSAVARALMVSTSVTGCPAARKNLLNTSS